MLLKGFLTQGAIEVAATGVDVVLFVVHPGHPARHSQLYNWCLPIKVLKGTTTGLQGVLQAYCKVN